MSKATEMARTQEINELLYIQINRNSCNKGRKFMKIPAFQDLIFFQMTFIFTTCIKQNVRTSKAIDKSLILK